MKRLLLWFAFTVSFVVATELTAPPGTAGIRGQATVQAQKAKVQETGWVESEKAGADRGSRFHPAEARLAIYGVPTGVVQIPGRGPEISGTKEKE